MAKLIINKFSDIPKECLSRRVWDDIEFNIPVADSNYVDNSAGEVLDITPLDRVHSLRF